MRPDPMLQMNGSPASVIKREHEKKKKQKPIRMIMKEIPSFIQELKPCFLMSPLSVSTFLPDDMEFDVTIFDEASQVFPEDAIVAIYRSKQLIVVGDSKQMPPTKFFMTGDSDDFEYDENDSDIDSYVYMPQSLPLIRPLRKQPRVIAGLMWQPLIPPMV